MSLATAVDNLAAQRLYESVGYRRDDAFHHFHFRVEPVAQHGAAADRAHRPVASCILPSGSQEGALAVSAGS